MKLGKKILTMCQQGNNRSVCLGWMLKEKTEKEVIAIGLDKIGEKTLFMLMEWADNIIITDKRLHHWGFQRFKEKIIYFDVGPDRYWMGYHPELIAQFKEYLKQILL